MYPPVKRLLDVVITAVALLCLLPLMVLIGLLVKLDSPGPVLFRSRRLGKDGVPFNMYKFRSMKDNSPPMRNPDGSCYVGKDDPRITRFGRVLRESSLDELPQLWNVLIGDMSLIGPRPDEEWQAEFFDDLLRAKLCVRPGITGLTAVRGRNALPWHERAELDDYYVKHLSLLLDLKILLQTPFAVFSRVGVYGREKQPGIRVSQRSHT